MKFVDDDDDDDLYVYFVS